MEGSAMFLLIGFTSSSWIMCTLIVWNQWKIRGEIAEMKDEVKFMLNSLEYSRMALDKERYNLAPQFEEKEGNIIPKYPLP